MTISLNSALSNGYTSNSQKARVLTESWVFENLYCPVCGNERISRFPNNQAVADFYCPACQEQFELKSKNGELKGKIVDGAYDTFIKRIEGDTNPDFLFMGYRMDDYLVHHLYFVPKFFFVPEMVEKRKPLGLKARRAGWIGCNILYDHIPEQGRIAIVHNTVVINQKCVQEQVQRAFTLKIDNLESRGWMFDVLHCVNGISSDEFSLAQMYQFEEILTGLLYFARRKLNIEKSVKISGKFLAPVRQKALPVRLYKCEGGYRPNGSSQGSGLRARRSDCKNGQ